MYQRDPMDGKFYTVSCIPLVNNNKITNPANILSCNPNVFLHDAGLSLSKYFMSITQCYLKDIQRVCETILQSQTKGRLNATIHKYGSCILNAAIPAISDVDAIIEIKESPTSSSSSSSNTASLFSFSGSRFLQSVATRLKEIYPSSKLRRRIAGASASGGGRRGVALQFITVKLGQDVPSLDLAVVVVCCNNNNATTKRCTSVASSSSSEGAGVAMMDSITDFTSIVSMLQSVQLPLDIDICKVYQGALRIIKIWAYRRQIYGSSLGYIGGGGYALLLARVLYDGLVTKNGNYLLQLDHLSKPTAILVGRDHNNNDEEAHEPVVTTTTTTTTTAMAAQQVVLYFFKTLGWGKTYPRPFIIDFPEIEHKEMMNKEKTKEKIGTVVAVLNDDDDDAAAGRERDTIYENVKKRDTMAIIAPITGGNLARNTTRSTTTTILKEFQRAAAIMDSSSSSSSTTTRTTTALEDILQPLSQNEFFYFDDEGRRRRRSTSAAASFVVLDIDTTSQLIKEGGDRYYGSITAMTTSLLLPELKAWSSRQMLHMIVELERKLLLVGRDVEIRPLSRPFFRFVVKNGSQKRKLLTFVIRVNEEGRGGALVADSSSSDDDLTSFIDKISINLEADLENFLLSNGRRLVHCSSSSSSSSIISFDNDDCGSNDDGDENQQRRRRRRRRLQQLVQFSCCMTAEEFLST